MLDAEVISFLVAGTQYPVLRKEEMFNWFVASGDSVHCWIDSRQEYYGRRVSCQQQKM